MKEGRNDTRGRTADSQVTCFLNTATDANREDLDTVILFRTAWPHGRPFRTSFRQAQRWQRERSL